MKSLNTELILDIEEERIALPVLRNPKLTAGTMWTILKDMVGKDITKYSMPVILNEPLSGLQKQFEVFSFNYLLTKASQEPDSLKRMAYVSTYSIARFYYV